MSIFQVIQDEEDRIDQGDVFVDMPFPAADERVNAVVISQTCDLEHNKADFVQFISTVSFTSVIRDILVNNAGIDESSFGSDEVISRKKCDQAIDALRQNISGNLFPRYYLLLGYSPQFPESYLDFQKVFVMPFQQVYDIYMGNRITRIATPWIEQIVARYSGYSARVGTPDYSKDDLQGLLRKAGLRLPP